MNEGITDEMNTALLVDRSMMMIKAIHSVSKQIKMYSLQEHRFMTLHAQKQLMDADTIYTHDDHDQLMNLHCTLLIDGWMDI